MDSHSTTKVDAVSLLVNLREGNAVKLQPYLFFDGHCEETVEFHRSALGAEVTTLMRFEESLTMPMHSGCLPLCPIAVRSRCR